MFAIILSLELNLTFKLSRPEIILHIYNFKSANCEQQKFRKSRHNFFNIQPFSIQKGILKGAANYNTPIRVVISPVFDTFSHYIL
jgi:hypothetical protein